MEDDNVMTEDLGKQLCDTLEKGRDEIDKFNKTLNESLKVTTESFICREAGTLAENLDRYLRRYNNAWFFTRWYWNIKIKKTQEKINKLFLFSVKVKKLFKEK